MQYRWSTTPSDEWDFVLPASEGEYREVFVVLGRIVASYECSSTLYQIH